MIFFNHSIITAKLRASLLNRITVAAFIIAAPLTLTSCFTGIESTKKITLSKEDKKNLQPTAEEEFFRPVAPQPLADWKPGKKFIAADDRTALIFDQEGMPVDPMQTRMKGKILTFEGTGSRLAPDGGQNAIINFSDGVNTYKYNTAKHVDDAMQQVTSGNIPMLIDSDMIESARSLLVGKKLWTRSPLWYDASGDRITGLKFVPVTVTEVIPGTIAFPLKVAFTDETGKKAWALLNFGNSGTESRSFANVFSLSDIRQRYPQIEDEVWALICRGKVRAGMTKEECKLSLGNPSEVDQGHDYAQTLDLWHFPDGAVLWFEDGFLTRFRQ